MAPQAEVCILANALFTLCSFFNRATLPARPSPAFPVPPLSRRNPRFRNRQRRRQVPQRHHPLRSLRHGTITAAPVARTPAMLPPNPNPLHSGAYTHLTSCARSFYVNPFPHACQKVLGPQTCLPPRSVPLAHPSTPLAHSLCSLPLHSPTRSAPLTHSPATHAPAPLLTLPTLPFRSTRSPAAFPPLAPRAPRAPRAPLAQYGDTQNEDPHALPVTVKIAEDAKYLVFVCDPEPDVR